MDFTSLDELCGKGKALLAKGPVALILVEDMAEIASTVRHHADLGFRAVIVFLPDGVAPPDEVRDRAHWVRHDTHAPGALPAAVNAVIAERLARGEARPFPDPPGRDRFGLPIAIWA